MSCAWQEYVRLLPPWMRKDVDFKGRDTLQELRLRVGQVPKMHLRTGTLGLQRAVVAEDLQYVINAASQYSPWAAVTISQGYLTASGGHRIGICGEAVLNNGLVNGIKNPNSLCLRVSRDFPGFCADASTLKGSTLIIGPPGSGKTTFLRDLVRSYSARDDIGCIGVVDEREEIFPMVRGDFCYPIGENTDILSGCPKSQGLEMVLRTMGPAYIAVDEISREEDCSALLKAGWCGVSLLATAHAHSRKDLLTRPVYKSLLANRLFDNLIVLKRDKSWRVEEL